MPSGPATEVTSEVKPAAEPVVEAKESSDTPAAAEPTVSEPAVITTTTDADPSAVTSPEESQEVKAAAAVSAAPVTPEKSKGSFASTLKRGLNVALNPKAGLDGSNGKSKLALKSKANDTINLAATTPESSTPAEPETKTIDPVANKENTSSSPEPAAKSEETTPSKSRAFANLRRRMSEGFSSPLVSARDKKENSKKEEPKDETATSTAAPVVEPAELVSGTTPAVDATENKPEAPPTPSAKDKGSLRIDTGITDKSGKAEAKAEASFRKSMDKSAERVDKLAHSATDQVTKAAQGLVHSIEAAAQKAEGFLRKSGETRQTGASSKKNSTAAGTSSDNTTAFVVEAAPTSAEATPTNTSEKTSQQFIGNVKKFFGSKTPEGTPSKKKSTTAGSSATTPAATEDGVAPAQVLEVPAEPTPAPQPAAPPSSPNAPITTSKAKKRESIFGTLTQAGRKVSDFVKEELEKKHEKENAAALAAKETKKTDDVPTSPAAAVTGEESQSKTEAPAEGNGTAAASSPAPDTTKKPEEVATDATPVSKDEKEAVKDEDVKKKSSLEGWALLLKDKVSGGSKSKE